MQYQKHCPGCFKRKDGEAVCPSCGYDESVPRSPIFLPYGSMLAGQYRIGRVLGKPGGFGITYLGWDVNLQQRVAIKEFMPPEIAARVPESLNITVHTQDHRRGFDTGKDYFLREARTVAQLDHPNIVRVRNFFNANDTAYLVMDYYEGMTLEEYLTTARPTLDASLAISVMRPILDGLRAVHEKGLIHRDIKPHNVYLATIGRSILLDFGAARQAMGSGGRSMSVVLTEGYAPLEQYQRRSTQGPWTDVYGAAATLYRAIKGEGPPFALDRLQHDPLAEQNYPGIPEGLRPALAKALAVRPEDRYQTAQDFMDALDAFKASLSGPAPEPIKPPPAKVEPPESLTPPRTVTPPTIPRPMPPAAPVLTPPPAAAETAPASAPSPLKKVAIWALTGAAALAVWFIFLYQPDAYQPPAPPNKPRLSASPAAAPAALPASTPKELLTGSAPGQPLSGAQRELLPRVVSLRGGEVTLADGEGRETVQVAPFRISPTEVSLAQFRLFIEHSGYENPNWATYPCEGGGSSVSREGWNNPGYAQTEQHPVVCVSWRDARAYTAWLSGQTGKLWRLPSEAEWDYATRAGTRTRYWWGADFKAGVAACSDCPPQTPGKPAFVGSGSPNSFGLHHTADNVREWTCSVFETLGSGASGRCGASGDSARVSVRGGSWKEPMAALESSHRAWMEADRRNAWTGFRVVQE